MKRKDLARRAASAAMAACMMFTLSAPALAESTDALMQLSIGSYHSSSLLSEKNSFPAIKVNGKTVDEGNKDDILDGQNKGKLSYDETTNTLKSNAIGSIMGNLTIDAPGVNIVLDNPDNPVTFGKLTVTNAQDVKVTSQDSLAVIGAVEISCDGEVEITSGESYAVTNNVTVKRASKVAISGKSDTNHIVTGDVTIVCHAPVTIQNKGTGGMANSIVYSGGKYVYSAAEGGAPVDPATDPIKNHLNSGYLRITPVTLYALTVKNGTVPGGTSTTKPNNQTTTSAMVAKGDVVEIEGKNFDNAKKAFDQWKVEKGDAEISDPYKEKTTLTVKGEGEVTVKASYMTPRTVTVTDDNGTVKGLTQHGTENIFAGDTVEVTAKKLPGKLFDHWEVKNDNVTLTDPKSAVTTFKMPKDDVTLTAVYKEAKTLTLKHGTIRSVTRGGAPVSVTDNMELFKGDVVEITPNNRLDEKMKFGHWNVKSGNVTLNGIKTATFTMPDEPVELEAVYNNLYTVTVNDGTATDTINHIAGDTVTVKANVPEGEKFTGWKVKNNTALSLKGQSIDLTQPVITFTMPRTNITLTAEHKTIHTLYVVGGTIDGSGKSIQAIEGESITVHSALAPNQQFLHWTSEGMGLTDSQSKNDPLTITMPDSDVTITAVPKQLYTVTVVNGTVHDKSADTVNPGDPVTINAADRTALGEVFVGWTVTSTDVNGQPNVQLNDPTAESTTFTMIGANVEVEAKYEKQHTVTVKYQTETGTTEDTSQKKTAIFGEDIKVKAEDKTADGLIFDHWEVTVGGDTVTDLFADYESDDPPAFKMRRDNVTLTAVYKKLYTITITDNVNHGVVGTKKTKVGGTVSLEAAPIPGYRFKSWNVISHNATVTDAGLTLNGAGDVLVQAEYVQLYNLTVNHGTAVNADADVNDNPAGSAAEGDSITATANAPTPDQIFTGWKVEGGEIGLTAEELKKPEITFTMPAGAVTLTPNYSYVHDQTVKVVNGTAHTGDTPESEEIIATPGETVYIEPADRWEENQIFTKWQITSGKGVNLDYADDGTVSFIMPQSDEIVEITAQYAKLNAVTINDGDVIDADGYGINNMNDDKLGAIAGTNITIKAKDKSAEGKVFDYWEIITGDNVTLTSVNDDGSVATFKMIGDAVEITARYANVHDVTVHSDDLSYSKTVEDIKVGTPYKVTAPEIAKKRFDHWYDNNGNLNDLDVKAGTFTMPDGNVDLTAVYVDLYDLTVNYGTAVDANGNPAGSAAKGDPITVTAGEPYPTETFEGWTLISGTIHVDYADPLPMDDEGYILKADGTRLTDRSFSFVMCDGAVELKANYSMPAYVMPQWVTVEGGTAFAEGEAAAAEISADPGKRITVIADPNADPNMIFDYWEVTSLDEDGKATVKLEDATSMTTSFTMPMAPVELTAHWRTIDEAPSSDDDGAGAAIAGVAIGGAAIWGGYEITTRVILNDLLPEGAAIPANRGELAMLLWQTAGKPEPAAQPAFADVADSELAKAAQWCVEQGLLDAKDGKFDPNGWMPKFKTIEVWKKAFPKQ